MNTNKKLLGAIEAGGTKFNCSVAFEPTQAIERASFPTTTPEETLALCVEFFRQAVAKHGEIEALGIGSFGPLELNTSSSAYGSILKTPKPHWSHCALVDYFSEVMNVPIGFETDVNAAALGEHLYGAGRGIENIAYVTIGTGIGAGFISQGKIYNGGAHPEVGHMLMPRDPAMDPFEGICPFHGDCLEGLACGPAIEKRWGLKGSELANKLEVWELQSHYLAIMCVNLVNICAPEKIILGGGVMKQKQLFPLIRSKFEHIMNGYSCMEALNDLDSFITEPEMDGFSGEAGALSMALELI